MCKLCANHVQITYKHKNKPKKAAGDEKSYRHAQILSDHLKKCYRNLPPSFKRAHIDVFRLYDRDIPEVPLWVVHENPLNKATPYS